MSPIGTVDDPTVAAPVETVTPIRPSEAMRLGRLLYPIRVTGQLAAATPGGMGVCALGAVHAGYGWTPVLRERWLDPDTLVLSRNEYRWFGTRLVAHPEPCPTWSGTVSVRIMVTHLNDTHDWDTERIATFLEEIGL